MFCAQVSTEGPKFLTLAEDAMLTVVMFLEHPPSLIVILDDSNHLQENVSDLADKDGIISENQEYDGHWMDEGKITILCESGISFPAPNMSIFCNNKRLMTNNVLFYKEEEITISGFVKTITMYSKLEFFLGFHKKKRIIVDLNEEITYFG